MRYKQERKKERKKEMKIEKLKKQIMGRKITLKLKNKNEI